VAAPAPIHAAIILNFNTNNLPQFLSEFALIGGDSCLIPVDGLTQTRACQCRSKFKKTMATMFEQGNCYRRRPLTAAMMVPGAASMPASKSDTLRCADGSAQSSCCLYRQTPLEMTAKRHQFDNLGRDGARPGRKARAQFFGCSKHRYSINLAPGRNLGRTLRPRKVMFVAPMTADNYIAGTLSSTPTFVLTTAPMATADIVGWTRPMVDVSHFQ